MRDSQTRRPPGTQWGSLDAWWCWEHVQHTKHISPKKLLALMQQQIVGPHRPYQAHLKAGQTEQVGVNAYILLKHT